MQLALKLGRLIVLVATALVLWLSWPQSFGGRIAYVRVDGHSMDPTLHSGDVVVVRSQPAYAVGDVGDVVTYRIPQGEFGAGARVVHRLVAGDGRRGFTTRGDNRTIDDSWHPRTRDVVGRVVTRVPGGGKLLGELSQPVNLGAPVRRTHRPGAAAARARADRAGPTRGHHAGAVPDRARPGPCALTGPTIRLPQSVRSPSTSSASCLATTPAGTRSTSSWQVETSA